AKADVFVQNLKPGAVAKLGFALDALRRAHPRLVICSISGYGEDGPYAARKAYDMLVQAESGLASVTRGPEAPARVGVSVCDIAAGMNAYEAILAALFSRAKTGDGAAISISMFDAMAEWMAVPLIQYEGGAPHKRMGLAHTSIAPYGAFKTKDGADILISIQSDREGRVLAETVVSEAAAAADPAFATNVERVKRRAETDARAASLRRRSRARRAHRQDLGRVHAAGEAQVMRHPRRMLGVFPSPLWGGVRGGGDCVRQRRRVTAPPPSPALPHKGGRSIPSSGREQTECGGGGR